ncbi:MAG: pectinesterase family protein [Faecousia sp.]
MAQTISVSPKDDLQAVFDAAEENAVIRLAPGDYRQKTVIRTPGLTLVGAGADKTRIVWDDYAKKLDEKGVEYNTFRTYTMAVCTDGVTMRELSVVNDALHPEQKGQEVALSVVGDRFTMEKCVLSSTQDTLFAGPLPPDLIARYVGFLRDGLRRGGGMEQIYRDCRIEGTVDFIFGCARALFDHCEIRSLADARDIGYAAAPAHSFGQNEGFLFRECAFTAEEGVTPGSIYLARPWRDYGLAEFQSCTYGPHIAAEGFDKWNDTRRDLTARFYESPEVPGRVGWINRK